MSNLMDILKSVFYRYLLPRKWMSRQIGRLVYWRGGAAWSKICILVFSKSYHIDLGEAEYPIDRYPSLGDFFIRRLRDGIRPLGIGPIVHPADSVITQTGTIRQLQLVQAKGRYYTASELTQDPEALSKWNDGLFATYYLCPTDYHRVHSPIAGEVVAIRRISGDLWPVNDWSTRNIDSLFAINERVVVELRTAFGPVAVVFVGATNVGSIELSEALQKQEKSENKVSVIVKKGEELGMFRMGSTVIVLYSDQVPAEFLGEPHFPRRVQVNADFLKSRQPSS